MDQLVEFPGNICASASFIILHAGNSKIPNSQDACLDVRAGEDDRVEAVWDLERFVEVASRTWRNIAWGRSGGPGDSCRIVGLGVRWCEGGLVPQTRRLRG